MNQHDNHDPADARAALVHACAARQLAYRAVRPPDPERQEQARAMIERAGALRGRPLWYPYLATGNGHGPYVEMVDGSVKLDFATGIGVNFFGHNHPDLLAHRLEAVCSGTVMRGNLHQSPAECELMAELLEAANEDGAGLSHCFLTTSGAMANENALKLLFYHRQPADRLLAFQHAFAGRTIALAHLTDKPANRIGLPPALAVDYLPFCQPDNPAASTELAVAVLREHVARYPGRHAGLCAELIQGEAGFYPGTRPFFQALFTEARRLGVPILIDEIQTFGRTERTFAFHHFQLSEFADIVTVGKMLQTCATLFRADFAPGTRLLSQTFTASAEAIAAARWVLSQFRTGDFRGSDGRNTRLHAAIRTHLQAMAARHPRSLCGPYGMGAMIACTLFNGDAEATHAFLQALFRNGLIAFVAGEHPTRVRFLPPFGTLTLAHIDEAMSIFERTLEQEAERQGG